MGLPTAAPSLTVHLAGLEFQNPVIAAAGTFAYGEELSPVVDWSRLGGFVCKGLSLRPRNGNPAPRLIPAPAGMLNSVGLQNVGVEAFLKEVLPKLEKQRGKAHVIANIFGESAEDYGALAGLLAGAPGLSAVELNLSCPNVHRGADFSKDPAATGEVVAIVRRQLARQPLFAKLAPDTPDLTGVARAAQDAGADGLVIANTFPAMVVDTEIGRPALPLRTGGLSGPAIRAIVVRLVDRLMESVRIPVVGCGGVAAAPDALEYLMVGASAVQVGTAHFVNPRASVEIVEGLEAYLRRRNHSSIHALIGMARQHDNQ